MNEYVAGVTSIVETIFLQDSASTTGAGKTGLAYNTGSLTCYYKRSNGTASVAVTLANITTLGTFVSGGFKEIDGTNMPGIYEFHPPDAAFASGAKEVVFYFKGASGMVERPIKFRILAVNPDDSVRGGMTALPNAVANGSGGVPVIGTGANNFKSDSSANVTVGAMATNSVTADAMASDAEATIAATVWERLFANHTTPGSFGKLLNDVVTDIDGIPVAVRDVNNDNPAGSSFGASAKAALELPGATDVASAVRTELATELARIDAAISTRAAPGNEMDLVDAPNVTAIGAIADALVDGLWDEPTSGHQTAGTTGKALIDAGSGGNPWSTTVSGNTTAGTFGAAVNNILDDTGTTGVLLADSEDVYPADIQFTRDDTNDKDEYTVLWFRNGTPVTSGITVPLIQVVKRADGTDLIASTAMTQIGATGAYKYDESTAGNRVADGEAVVVICTATINGSARSWRKTVTRDQTS